MTREIRRRRSSSPGAGAVRTGAGDRGLRTHLWAEHLGTAAEAIAGVEPVRLIDTLWKKRAQENVTVIPSRVSPLFSQVHRYESGRVPGTWLLEESEMLTFEH